MRPGAEHEIHVEQLRVLGRVGVTAKERAKRQRLVLNITAWPARDLRDVRDSINRTVDYVGLCREIKSYLAQQSPKLLETLVENLSAHLLRQFRIAKIRLEARKFVLKDAAYVSVATTACASLD